MYIFFGKNMKQTNKNRMSSTSITTVRNGGNMSRYEMLEWMNSKAQEHITRIEDLCTGVAYCRMMEAIFPNSINMKRVNMSPRRTYEYRHNLRLLQEAFNRLELEQAVPIDLIVQGRFKHNFEFIQFFKKFYDSQQTKSPMERKILAPKKTFKASRGYFRMKAAFKTKSGVVEEDLKSQDVHDEEDTLPEDPEDILDMAAIRAKWLRKGTPLEGPEAELTEKLIDERDLAYHKLIWIEREIAKIENDERGVYGLIRDVLKARMPAEMPERKAGAEGEDAPSPH